MFSNLTLDLADFSEDTITTEKKSNQIITNGKVDIKITNECQVNNTCCESIKIHKESIIETESNEYPINNVYGELIKVHKESIVETQSKESIANKIHNKSERIHKEELVNKSQGPIQQIKSKIFALYDKLKFVYGSMKINYKQNKKGIFKDV